MEASDRGLHDPGDGIPGALEPGQRVAHIAASEGFEGGPDEATRTDVQQRELVEFQQHDRDDTDGEHAEDRDDRSALRRQRPEFARTFHRLLDLRACQRPFPPRTILGNESESHFQQEAVPL